MTDKRTANAIKAAYDAIAYLSETTNWSDPAALADAIKLERREGLSLIEAKAQVVTAWQRGAAEPDAAVRSMYFFRPGYLRAYLLGVRHAVERADSEYTGPLFAKALALCPAAVEAYRADIMKVAA